MSHADRLWFGDEPLARAARGALVPLAALYGGATAVRNALFDRGLLRARAAPLPAVSVGNLAVGGAGKTPFAAWLASRLAADDARPGIVLRGYGGDEPAVHALLNPGVPVIVDADRHRGAVRARGVGCQVVVFDDAFQHRRAARLEDVVLVSADRWQEPRRLLPAGPWREPLAALARASLVVVTRKTAAPAQAAALAAQLAPATRTGAGAAVAFSLGRVHEVGGGRAFGLDALRGQRLLAIAGVADPEAFRAQLAAEGADVDLVAFPDHHPYDAGDVRRLAARAASVDHVVCTLKDAVKLQFLWPRAAPGLWYVSLHCAPEAGTEALEAVLHRLAAARHPMTSGLAG